MSTRSGKRIHSSVVEEIQITDVKSKRKTRSNKQKENCENIETISKKKHFVRYPSDDDVDGVAECKTEIIVKPPRQTLQELNGLGSEESDTEKKPIRLTRRTKKIEDEIAVNDVTEGVCKKTKKKKNVKKVSTSNSENSEYVIGKNKLSKKKKKKKSSIIEDNIENGALNRSDMSVDSFHSAAGSTIVSPNNCLVKVNVPKKVDSPLCFKENKSERSSNNLDLSLKQSEFQVSEPEFNGHTDLVVNHVEKKIKKKKARKRSLTSQNEDVIEFTMRNNSYDTQNTDVNTKTNKEAMVEPETESVLNNTFEKEKPDENCQNKKVSKKKSKVSKEKVVETETDTVINTTFEKETPCETNEICQENKVAKKKSKLNKEKVEMGTDTVLNTTFEKDTPSEITNICQETKVTKKKSKISKEKVVETDEVVLNTTFEKEKPSELTKVSQEKNIAKKSKISKEIVVETPSESFLNNTFDKEKADRKSSIKNSTFDKISEPCTPRGTPKNKSFDQSDKKRRSSLILLNNSNENSSKKQKSNGSIKSLNSTYDKTPDLQRLTKNSVESTLNTTFEKDGKMNATFEKENLNSTYDKSNEKVSLDATFDKLSDNSKKSSLISSDRSNITDDKSNSRISITSDDSRENIVNTTPVLIESSMEESFIKTVSPDKNSTPGKSEEISPHTLKREGTFTKESNSPITKVSDKTPSKRLSVPSPGRTPFPSSKKSASKEKYILNVTRSIEKSRRSSVADLPRATRVMFCSPVNNPVIVNQMRGKVIKSNLKGSNKSFIFNESVSDIAASARKRSYTQSDADDASVKRKRLADDLQHSVDRLSRPRTTSASAKLQDVTPSKQTPQKKDKLSRTKLPNFAALHQKQFSKMESLDECQQRKAKRAKRMLAVSSSGSKMDRSNAKDKDTKTKESKKTDSPVKPQLPTLESLNPGYTRFGFKMNSDVNPFADTTKNDLNTTRNNLNSTKTDLNSTKTNLNSTKTNLNSTKTRFNSTKNNATKTDLNSTKNNFNSTKTNLNSTKTNLNSTKTNFNSTITDKNLFLNGFNSVKSNTIKPDELKVQTALPSLTGATARKEMARQTIMREKSFTEKRNVNRKENRSIIKGVRTNRRFELQMKMRNINGE